MGQFGSKGGLRRVAPLRGPQRVVPIFEPVRVQITPHEDLVRPEATSKPSESSTLERDTHRSLSTTRK